MSGGTGRFAELVGWVRGAYSRAHSLDPVLVLAGSRRIRQHDKTVSRYAWNE